MVVYLINKKLVNTFLQKNIIEIRKKIAYIEL